MEQIWVFDIDGVLSDPVEKRIVEPGLVDQLVAILRSGEPIALNTGRSIEWVQQAILPELLPKVSDLEISKLLFVSGEKGATWLRFENGCQPVIESDDSIQVPLALKQEVASLIQARFADSMFYDESKTAMISIEMHDGYSLEAYRIQQLELFPMLQELVRSSGNEDRLRLDVTSIAVDIEECSLGKDLGIRRIIEWWKDLGIAQARVRAIGDSTSDFKMAEELSRQDYEVEFCFVGGQPRVPTLAGQPFELVLTAAQDCAGTVEYLRKILGPSLR